MGVTVCDHSSIKRAEVVFFWAAFHTCHASAQRLITVPLHMCSTPVCMDGCCYRAGPGINVVASLIRCRPCQGWHMKLM